MRRKQILKLFMNKTTSSLSPTSQKLELSYVVWNALYYSHHLELISPFQILQSITESKQTIKTEAVHWITIWESCSTSARALRTSRSKSMAFCQALCATVTRPPQPGPPHFFCPSSVLQFGPPHSVSEQEAPGGVPQVCKEPGNRPRFRVGTAVQGLSGPREHGGGAQQVFRMERGAQSLGIRTYSQGNNGNLQPL